MHGADHAADDGYSTDGGWAAQPVYDKIQAEYWTGDSNWGTGIADANKLSEQIFVDGYVQATKSGKMGLLDSTGKEIVKPNKYIADYERSAAGSAIRFGSYYKPASENRMVCKFGFNGGYALE